jgi:hypothetical protein
VPFVKGRPHIGTSGIKCITMESGSPHIGTTDRTVGGRSGRLHFMRCAESGLLAGQWGLDRLCHHGGHDAVSE